MVTQLGFAGDFWFLSRDMLRHLYSFKRTIPFFLLQAILNFLLIELDEKRYRHYLNPNLVETDSDDSAVS